jgi:peptide/nickel transport system ATP-binding protein
LRGRSLSSPSSSSATSRSPPQIINLLKNLQRDFGLTYLFISHDLSVVEHISDAVGVMYLGSMVEYGSTEDIFDHPLHPYTKALFSAIPVPDPDVKITRTVLQGSLPSPANPPKGCKFHTRCPDCMEICSLAAPEWAELAPGHFCACHLHNDAERAARALENAEKTKAEEQEHAKKEQKAS